MGYRKLIKGFNKFKEDYFQTDKKEFYQKLVKEGQNPDTLVIACSDSRIDPAILTDSIPGDFFAVRNVAALVPPYAKDASLHGTSSAIEYAVRALQVKHIIVLGHAECGGMCALATDTYKAKSGNEFDFIENWLDIASDAKEMIDDMFKDISPHEKATLLEKAGIIVSMENLLTFPWIKARYDAGDIKLHGWYFDMKRGALLEYSSQKGEFANISSHVSEGVKVDYREQLKNYLETYKGAL